VVGGGGLDEQVRDGASELHVPGRGGVRVGGCEAPGARACLLRFGSEFTK
jgi:hypothetical protein